MIWIDVEDSSGTKYGSGPVTDITEYSITRRLDSVGRVGFSVPLATSKRDILQPKRYLTFRDIVNGEPANVASGIIDDLNISTAAAGAGLTVSADDLLRELTYRSVGTLGIYEDRDLTAQDGYYLEGDSGGGGMIHNDMLEIWDGDPASSYNEFYFTPKDSAFPNYLKVIYVGFGEPIDFLRVDISRYNTRAGELTYQYYDGAWQDITIESDTTGRINANGDTVYWDHDGLIKFEGTPGWVPGGGDNVNLYYVRVWLGSDYEESTRVNINEISGVVRDPSTAGIGMILGAPTNPEINWRLDATGHQLTSRPVVVYFDGETVLEALVILTEQTGDHFRLSDGRSIKWMWADDVQYPVLRCVSPGNAVDVLDNDDVAVILNAQRARGSYELATRVYPTGGRYGNDRLTLAALADDLRAPYGYTLSRDDNYLERDGSRTTYGLIEARRTWAEIVPETSRDLEPAAEALFWAAYEWLRRYSEPQDAYTITCVKVVPTVRPGDRIHVSYHEYDDDGAVLNIEQLLYVLEVNVSSNQDGTSTHTFVASTVDVWPDSEAAYIVRLARQVAALDTQINGLAGADDLGNAQTALQTAMATQLEVRNQSDVPMIRVMTADNGGRIGVPTAPGIDWDEYGVVVGGVSVDGPLVFHGNGRPVQEYKVEAVTTTLGASAPTSTTRAAGASGGVLVPVLRFSNTVQQDIYFIFHAPEGIDETFPCEFHLMWIPGASWSAGNYLWKIEYLVKDENGAAINTGTPTTISVDVTPASAVNLIETHFADTVTVAAEQLVFAHLYRDVAGDNGDDVADVTFVEVEYALKALGE